MAQHLYKNYGRPHFEMDTFPSVKIANGNFTEIGSGLLQGGGIRLEYYDGIYSTSLAEPNEQYFKHWQSVSQFFEINNFEGANTNLEKNKGICILAVPMFMKMHPSIYSEQDNAWYNVTDIINTYDTYIYLLLSTEYSNYEVRCTTNNSDTYRYWIDGELDDSKTTTSENSESTEPSFYSRIMTRQTIKSYFTNDYYIIGKERLYLKDGSTPLYEWNMYEQAILDIMINDYDKYFVDMPFIPHIGFLSGSSFYNVNGVDTLWKSITTTLPIFGYDQMEEVAKYFKNGDYSNALNKDEIDLLSLDWSTDWTLYVDGKQPNLKLVWKSDALEKYLDSDKNTTNITLDSVKVEISQNDISGNRVILDYVPYTNGNYKTNYARLAEKFNMNEWDKFLSSIIGSQTGIGDIPIYFKIYYGKLYSTLCYCKIPYSTVPTEYGRLPSIELQDNSTVTVVYGSDGTGDDGYTKPTENDDLPLDGTGGIVGGANVSGIFSRTYLMTTERISQLSAFLWGDNFFQNIKLLNNSPIENIVSCKLMPCSVSGVDEPITLGNVSTGVNGDKTSSSLRVEIGSLNIPEYYHSFLDYAPYTKLTIFLPFIGFKEIDTNLFMGKTLTIYYVFDFITGAIKAQLYANNIYVYTFDAIGGIDIPITASNRAQVESGYIKSALTVGAGIASGNALAIGGGILSLATPQYHYNTSGAFSPSCGFHDTRLVYVIYDRPIVQYPSGYNHNIGKPCKLSQNFNSLNGFTIVENGVELSSIPCTAEEREEILQLLSSGVYL